MNLCHRNPRHLGPRLICISVIIQKFVAEHERHSEKTVFTTGLALDTGIEFFEAVNEQKGKNDDVLCHLGCREDCRHPFAEACGGDGFGHQRLSVVIGCRVISSIQGRRALKPEQACDLGCN